MSPVTITISKRCFLILFILVALGSAAFRVYKTHYTGITYDERGSYYDFGQSVDAATGRYTVNNHVINSILIYFAHEFFGSYEHFLRIPSALSGILFMLSVAYIIYMTIRSEILRIILLGFITLNYFVFDLSFLARGYSIALMAVYAEIALIVYLLNKKDSADYRWMLAIVILNFIAFGSMLTSIYLLSSINLIFILLYSSGVFRIKLNKKLLVVLNFTFVFVLSALLVGLLYRKIYKYILAAPGLAGQGSIGYIKVLLVDKTLNFSTWADMVISWVFIVLLVLGLSFLVWRFIVKARGGLKPLPLNYSRAGTFLFLSMLLSVCFMFIHATLLNKSLGYLRNGVFVIPLVMLNTGMLLERLCQEPKGKFLTGFVRSAIFCVLILVTLRNLPSAYAVQVRDWSLQSASGPLIRKLKAIDPGKTWNIGVSKEHHTTWWCLEYYKEFGYKVEQTHSRKFDILLYSKTDKPAKGVYFEKDYFNKFNSQVIIDFQPLIDKVF